jgi:hypothetical protein
MNVENESYDQFIARIDRPAKPLPIWGSALLFAAVFFILQMSFDACRGTSFEHFIIGDLTVVPTATLINVITPEVGVKALGNQLRAPGGGINVMKGMRRNRDHVYACGGFLGGCHALASPIGWTGHRDSNGVLFKSS